MRKRNHIVIGTLVFLCMVLFLCNIAIGTVYISISDLFAMLKGGVGLATQKEIILEIRLPRAIAAGVLGGGLALSGYLLQTFFHNPIAGPFVLGISSGAKLSVAAMLIIFLQRGLSVGSVGMILAAFFGAMLSMGIVLIFSVFVEKMGTLIIAGIMISYICSAITECMITFAEDSNIVNLHHWSQGSFSGTSWEHVRSMTVLIGVTFLFVLAMGKSIAAYQLGEGYAQSLGLSVIRFRVALVIFSSLLAACVTAYAGPISFVGIAVPNVVRFCLRSEKPVPMMVCSFLGGAVSCLGCDLLARVAFAPTELSISTVTAIFGAPIVLWIMLRRRKES